MDIKFTARGLFGGNIVVELPEDWIDASDRQPVPDHQEAFASSSGPFAAKVIFEITDPIDTHDHEHAGDDDDDDAANFSAANYYMDDLTDVTNDRWKTVDGPRSVSFKLSSMHQYAASYLEAEITERRPPVEGHSHDNIPAEQPPPHSWLHLLLVRVPKYHSEFVVQLIVQNGDLPTSTNSSIAKQIMDHMVTTLNFKKLEALIPPVPETTEQQTAMATGAA